MLVKNSTTWRRRFFPAKRRAADTATQQLIYTAAYKTHNSHVYLEKKVEIKKQKATTDRATASSHRKTSHLLL